MSVVPIQPTTRDAFAREFGAVRREWTGYGLSRFLRCTGERPQRVAEMRALLGALGLGFHRGASPSGAFDHGEMWSRRGKPWAIVGHPYGLNAERRELLSVLARTFPSLRVSIDDRPGHYQCRTNHVRIELVEPRKPWTVYPATWRTRRAARAFRKVLAEEFSRE